RREDRRVCRQKPRLAVLGVITALLVATLPLEARERAARPEEFAAATVRALAQAGLARDAIAEGQSDSNDTLVIFFKSMTALRKATPRLKEGVRIIQPYTETSDEQIRKAAQTLK